MNKESYQMRKEGRLTTKRKGKRVQQELVQNILPFGNFNLTKNVFSFLPGTLIEYFSELNRKIHIHFLNAFNRHPIQ